MKVRTAISRLGIGLVVAGTMGLPVITARAHADADPDRFGLVVRGPAVFNVLFCSAGPAGPNPAFRGGCDSPIFLCVEADIRSVAGDEVIGTMRVALQEFPVSFGDAFTVKVIRKFELKNGTITTPVLDDYHGFTSEAPRFGGTKTFYLGYRDDRGLATGTGRFARARILTEMRGRMETVETPIGAVPVFFDHLFLIDVAPPSR